MEAKSSVVKSKSSNSGKTVRSENRNKKSRSNAEFQPYVLKKRGVYVEKNPTKMNSNEPEKNQAQEKPIKAPPRPRPGNKKFLASVLTILSKSTTGTQYPDINDPVVRKKKRNPAVRRKPADIGKDNTNDVKVKRKTKYRSKALNDEVDKEAAQEQVVVLQPQKDIAQTPSIYSENDSYNWSNLPLILKTGQQNKETVEKNVKEVASELAREIMEGRKSRKDKRVRIDEPTTLVGQSIPKPERAANENEKGLYNFFVDLLETTISVYNVKAEYDKTPNPPSEVSSTKIPLEIDESVAKRLDIQKLEKTEDTNQPSSQFYCLKDIEFDQQGSSSPPTRYEAPVKIPRKKFKAQSFSFLRKPTARKLKAESVVDTKKHTSRKEKKKTLLNLFKEQLRMDDEAFEEPQNLYQALKVIAQNKRRCQKTIHFDDSARKKHRDMGFPECMFKSRKVLSPSTKSTKKNRLYPQLVTGKYSEIGGSKKKSKDYASDYDESYHSLEVYGFDYESRISKAPTNLEKQLVFTYHSTPSVSAHELGSKDLLDFSDTDTFFNDYCSTP